MKKIISLILVSTIVNAIYSQKIEFSEGDLQFKLDSILAEGNLLYKYEKAAWISTDLIMNERALKKDFGGFLVYEDKQEVKVIIQGKKSKKCIAEYVFENDFNMPKMKKHIYILNSAGMIISQVKNTDFCKREILSGL